MKIYPSLISSNLLNLRQTLKLFDSHCDGYHLDIMDDHFVPNLTWGPAFINEIRKATSLPLQVHLMVEKPETWTDRLALQPNDVFLFHYESYNNIDQCKTLINNIKQKNWNAGITINPDTPVEKIIELLPELETVLVMSVNPGFSGQSFIESTLKKIPLLCQAKKQNNLSFKICMDGGISENNIQQLVSLGVDQVGIASAIFSNPSPLATLEKLYKLMQS